MQKSPGILTFILILISVNTMCQKIKTVPFVDLEKYSGLWYEIASIPQRFQKGCTGTTAEYSLTDKGYVIVENECHKDSLTGKLSHIKGKAFVVKNSGNAKLLVQFFWPFKAKYWIIALAEDYSFAVVGHPNKKYLWILSRAPNMLEMTYVQIIRDIAKQGFDIYKIKPTAQYTESN